MGQHLTFFHPDEYVMEGSTWRPIRRGVPQPIILYDHAGVPIPSTQLDTIVLTLYDLPAETIYGTPPVEQVNIKNTGRGVISTQGVLTLTLTKDDTGLASENIRWQRRMALIEYTWPSGGANAGVIEIEFIVRQVRKRPYVAS